MPHLFLIRHGETALNDPDHERVRSWSDPPLDETGHKDAQDIAETLQNKQISHVYHSGLQRAESTARTIAAKTNSQTAKHEGLKPWNLGEMNGKLVSEVQPEINYYRKHPDSKVPGGESYNTFYDRWQEALLGLVHQTNNGSHDIAAVTHSQNFAAVPSIMTDFEQPVDWRHVPEPGQIVPMRVGRDRFSIEKAGSVETDE